MQVMSIAAQIPLHCAFSLIQILFMVLLHPALGQVALLYTVGSGNRIAVWGPTIDHDIRKIEDHTWCNYEVGLEYRLYQMRTYEHERRRIQIYR